MQEELERKNADLLALATTDELTGLKNRRRFFEDLDSQFALAVRGRSPLSLVLLDVDHFKAYNDAFGHPAGDDVLRGVAGAFRGVTRGHETVARHGGEEFAVLLPGSGPSVARGMAERLREAVERRSLAAPPGDGQLRGRHDDPGTGPAQELVDQADIALYSSKRRGRNRVTHLADIGGRLGGEPSVVGSSSRQTRSGWDRPILLPSAGPGPAPGQDDERGQVPNSDDIVDAMSRAWCSATARRSSTAAGSPRWCST